MLECRCYNYEELSLYLNTTDPQGIERKLKNYNVEFSKSGRGKKSSFNITAINNPFKIFAIYDLGADPHIDFQKFAYFIYLLLNDDGFNGMGAEMMEEYLRDKPFNISRQTIAKYVRRLQDNNLIDVAINDFVYYKVYKKYGVQTHEVVSRKEYSNAWKIYWDCVKNKGYDSFSAFSCMYSKFGGVPRKHPKIEPNGIYNNILNWLTEILEKDFGNIE